MPQNKDRQPFKGICHTDDDSYYIEITNGSISLCTQNDEMEEYDFEQIVAGLNKYNSYWYSNNALELQQHIEIMQLQDQIRQLEHWKQEAMEAWGPLMDWGQSQKDIKLGGSITEEILNRLNKAQKLVEALERISNPVKYLQQEAEKEGGILDGQAAFQISNDPVWLRNEATKALSSWKEWNEGKDIADKQKLARTVVAIAEEVSKDAGSAEAYLKSEGVDVEKAKADAADILKWYAAEFAEGNEEIENDEALYNKSDVLKAMGEYGNAKATEYALKAQKLADALQKLNEAVQHLFDIRKEKNKNNQVLNAWNDVANKLWDSKKILSSWNEGKEGKV